MQTLNNWCQANKFYLEMKLVQTGPNHDCRWICQADVCIECGPPHRCKCGDDVRIISQPSKTKKAAKKDCAIKILYYLYSPPSRPRSNDLPVFIKGGKKIVGYNAHLV